METAAIQQIRKSAEESFKSGLFCAESVVLAIAKAQGFDSDILPKIATAFCSGMSRSCGTCGALTGAIMGVSLSFGRSTATDSVQPSYIVTQQLIGAFEKEFGSSNCKVLLGGCDLSTPEGQATFKEQELRQRCLQITGKAAEIAAKVIVQNSENDYMIKRLDIRQTIGPNLTYSNDPFRYFGILGTHSSGEFIFNSGYAGIRLTDGQNVYYGWIQIRMNEWRPNLTGEVIDWAYNSSPGSPIPAGVTDLTDYGYDYLWEEATDTITITAYNGSDPHAVVPETIIGAPVARLYNGVFEDRDDILSVQLPRSLTHIGARAFSGCSQLLMMTLPANLLYIDDSAFANSDTMDAVYFQGTAPDHGSAVFDGSDSVIVYYLPSTEGWEESFAGRPTLPLQCGGGFGQR